jgi:hypothetical protein
VLRISEGAVRKRVTRGTLKHEKEQDGRIYVYLDAGARRGVDGGQDRGVDPNNNALISQLTDEVAYLRDENRRKDEIIMQQAMTMRQLSAAPPQGASESPETVEEEPDRAEPLSATEGAQESTELSQQRDGWLAPVDKLPWWQYVLGLLLVGLVALLGFSSFPVGNLIRAGVFAAGVFGLWVGFRRGHPRFRSQVIPFGVLVGVAVVLGDPATRPLGSWVHVYEAHRVGYFAEYLSGYLASTLVAGWLFYVSGALIGSAWQRRRTARLFGTTPASLGSRTAWTPRQQAFLGFVGTVIAALISLSGTIISTIVASGG